MEFLPTMGLLIYLDTHLCLTTCTSHCELLALQLLMQLFFSVLAKNSNVVWVRGCKPLGTYMENSGTLFKYLLIFLMQDINKLLSKHYPKHFYNKIFFYQTSKRFEVKVQTVQQLSVFFCQLQFACHCCSTEYLTGWLMQGKRFLTCSVIFQLPWKLLPKESQTPQMCLSTISLYKSMFQI